MSSCLGGEIAASGSRLTGLVLFLLAAGCGGGPALEPHVRMLAGDGFEGRETGTEGEKAAGEFIAAVLRGRNIEPVLQEFPGHGAKGTNVLGVLRGASAEAVVVGAHYDHLGRKGEKIWSGADDNASGVAVLLELARRLSYRRPRRTIVFASFSGEEAGLFGSKHYVKNPLVPLEQTVAMVNLDMVGRLREKLLVFGTGTGDQFRAFLEDSPLALAFPNDPFGPSDHTSFILKGVPSVHLFTGSHADYHKPTDTPEKIDYEGMLRIADLVETLVRRIADAPRRMQYVKVETAVPAEGAAPGARPYFGSMPDYGFEGKGCRLEGVAPGSPADQAGLKAGDVVVAIGGQDVPEVNAYSRALFSKKPGDEIEVTYLRGVERVTVKVTLAARKQTED